jgi:hypothetical protein
VRQMPCRSQSQDVDPLVEAIIRQYGRSMIELVALAPDV